MQDEFYAVAFRKKIYNTLDELQADLDVWLDEYNNQPTQTAPVNIAMEEPLCKHS